MGIKGRLDVGKRGLCMAQSVSILVINNGEYEVVGTTSRIPDEEDIEVIAIDNDMYGEISCEYISYNIGEGESGIDEFFTDDELIGIYNQFDNFGEFEQEIEKEGYDIDSYSSGSLSVYVEED